MKTGHLNNADIFLQQENAIFLLSVIIKRFFVDPIHFVHNLIPQ